MITIFVGVELTFRDGRVETIPLTNDRNDVSAWIPAFWPDNMERRPGWCPGNDMLVLVDGTVHKHVMGLVYLCKYGSRLDALAG